MDMVHSTRSGKVLLTLMFRNYSLMLTFILDSCKKGAIDKLYELIGYNIFKSTFPVILTDNDSEFKNPEMLEIDSLRNKRTKIFYCNPMASYQKPHVEKNHEYLRYVIPKGKSFDNLLLKDILADDIHLKLVLLKNKILKF